MNNLQTTHLDVDGVSLYTAFLPAESPRSDQITVVLMHGAGQASSARFHALAEYFSNRGVSVVMLDFLGHGETGGELSQNSLALRTEHALTAIRHWTSPETPLILCGSSMSGHTALRVSAQLGSQVRSLCLLQPAVYAAEAETVQFTDEFTEILRTKDSWQSSKALANADDFAGKALVMIGTEDKVIPWGVIGALTTAFKQSASETRIEVLRGVAHELPTWIPEHETVCGQLFEYLVN